MLENTFRKRLLSAPLDGGFSMEDYWIWCGSPIFGDDGKYHLFASRWPRALNFSPHWLTNSEIVRAGAGAEDACLWYEDGAFHVLLLDHDRRFSEKEILYGSSSDGINWKLDDPPLAISKRILWADGSIRKMDSPERPQVLMENGKSTHVFLATGSGEGAAQKTWSMSIPLR